MTETDGVQITAPAGDRYDEILTPDSSRYWLAGSYAGRHGRGEEPDSLDKEFLRLWVAGRCDPYHEPIPTIPDDTLVEFSQKYMALFETVTGQSIVVDGGQILPEIPG